MQKKLLYPSALCALFGISGIIFGMEEADQHTFLVLNSNNNEFVAFSRARFDQGKIYQNYDELNINNANWMKIQSPSIVVSTKPSHLIITDINDTLSTLSFMEKEKNIIHLVGDEINLGDFESKMIEAYLVEPNKFDICIFRAGTYHPITQITHQYLNKNTSTINVKSTAIESYEKGKRDEEVKQKKETLESKITRNSWIRNILLIGGGSILVFYYFFPDRFTQFFKSA